MLILQWFGIQFFAMTLFTKLYSRMWYTMKIYQNDRTGNKPNDCPSSQARWWVGKLMSQLYTKRDSPPFHSLVMIDAGSLAQWPWYCVHFIFNLWLDTPHSQHIFLYHCLILRKTGTTTLLLKFLCITYKGSSFCSMFSMAQKGVLCISKNTNE